LADALRGLYNPRLARAVSFIGDGVILSAGRFRRVALASCALLMSSLAAATAADFEVRSPIIDPDEFELDLKFARDSDRPRRVSRGRSLVGELEYGVTSWWSPAIEGEWNRPVGSDERTSFESYTFENRFQLAEQNEYWLDPGFFVEYERAASRTAPDVLRIGPLLRKDFGPTVNLLNILAVRERGGVAHEGLRIAYSWQTRWTLLRGLEPGLELYGGPAEGEARPAGTQHRGGPVLFGVLPFGNGHDLRYEAGYLFGLNRATPDGTVKLLIGYELQF
jgi:hypothetical protein